MQSATALKRPDVFKYDNYRLYLKHLLDYEKEMRGLSIREISRRAEFRSPNYLKLIIEEKRGLTPTSAARICEALELHPSESAFFMNLVSFNQSPNAVERRKHRDRLLQSRKFMNIVPLRSKSVSYYSRWYYIAIRELVALADFKEDLNWIARKLRNKVTIEDVAHAIRDLIDLALLSRGPDGRLVQVDKFITSDDKITSSAIIDFHLNMMDKGKEALETMPARERDISCVTLSADQETVEKMRLMIADFRRRLMSLAEECETEDRLVQINFQLFPLTQNDDGDGND